MVYCPIWYGKPKSRNVLEVFWISSWTYADFSENRVGIVIFHNWPIFELPCWSLNKYCYDAVPILMRKLKMVLVSNISVRRMNTLDILFIALKGMVRSLWRCFINTSDSKRPSFFASCQIITVIPYNLKFIYLMRNVFILFKQFLYICQCNDRLRWSWNYDYWSPTTSLHNWFLLRCYSRYGFFFRCNPE